MITEGQEKFIEITFEEAQEHLADFMERVAEGKEIVIVHRDKVSNAAIIGADELASLLEMAYLVSSPRNAERLFSALNRALRGEGKKMSLAELRHEVGLDEVEGR